MLRIIFIIVLFFLIGCKAKDQNLATDYKTKSLKLVYTDGSGIGGPSDSGQYEISGYNHYLFIENYDDNAFDNFLIDYADKYIDTCKTNVPIWSIIFCKPFNFEPTDDSWRVLLNHAIVRIGYGVETLHKKYPEISSITFYNNGKGTYIQTLTHNRARDKGYYDSAGRYKSDFIKEIDKKYRTSFQDAIKK
jgi:hypothetical protein